MISQEQDVLMNMTALGATVGSNALNKLVVRIL